MKGSTNNDNYLIWTQPIKGHCIFNPLTKPLLTPGSSLQECNLQ